MGAIQLLGIVLVSGVAALLLGAVRVGVYPKPLAPLTVALLASLVGFGAGLLSIVPISHAMRGLPDVDPMCGWWTIGWVAINVISPIASIPVSLIVIGVYRRVFRPR